MKIVRKYTELSIADIKKKVLENLQNANISCVLYEHNEVCTKEFLKNLIDSLEETAKQVEEEMDRETGLIS